MLKREEGHLFVLIDQKQAVRQRITTKEVVMMTTQFTRRLIAIAASGLLVGVLAAPAAAQTTTTNSGIEGKVADPTGIPLPGVTVTISSPALQAQPETFSGEDGRYRFCLGVQWHPEFFIAEAGPHLALFQALVAAARSEAAARAVA